MQRRLQGLVAASLLAASTLTLNAVFVPRSVLACSCMAPGPLVEEAAEPRRAVVLATIGQIFGGTATLEIEGTFSGAPDGDRMLVRGFGPPDGSCGHGANVGEHWLLVLYRDDEGVYSTNMCMLSGRLGTFEGDALLAEAIEVLGDPRVPPSPEPAADAPIDLSPWLGGLGWVAAVAGVGVAVLVLVVLVARRRPSD